MTTGVRGSGVNVRKKLLGNFEGKSSREAEGNTFREGMLEREF